MTTSAIRRAFEKLEPADQASLLTELADTLATSLRDADDRDNEVFDARRHEEVRARPCPDAIEGFARKHRGTAK